MTINHTILRWRAKSREVKFVTQHARSICIQKVSVSKCVEYLTSLWKYVLSYTGNATTERSILKNQEIS